MSRASPDVIARMAKARAAKGVPRLKIDVRNEYADMEEWERLASEAGLRLPLSGQRITTGGMRKWFKKVGITPVQYLDWSAEKNLSEFAVNNPRWSMRAFAGLVLEALDSGRFRDTETLEERYGNDPVLLAMYRKKLLVKMWAGGKDATENAFIRSCK